MTTYIFRKLYYSSHLYNLSLLEFAYKVETVIKLSLINTSFSGI
jgi:hypothetical protein